MRLPCLALLLGVAHATCVGGICARSPRTSPLVSPVVGGRYLYESMCDDDGLLCATIIDKAAFSFQLAEAIGSRFEAYQNMGRVRDVHGVRHVRGEPAVDGRVRRQLRRDRGLRLRRPRDGR